MQNVLELPESLLGWYHSQLTASGISAPLADYAGIALRTTDPLGFTIQYYDKYGDLIPGYIRTRVRNTDIVLPAEYGKRTGKLSKYTQEKGLGQRLYWPRVQGVNHAEVIGSIAAPIYIVEGEKKALRLQAELLKLGIKGSAIGVPGVLLGKAILSELATIPLLVEKSSRHVTVVFDWNDPDPGAEKETRTAEARLVSYLRNLGATISVLRWDGAPADTVQKIDDWLVSGGDLLKAEEYSKGLDAGADLDLGVKLHEFNDTYAVFNGKVLIQATPHVELSASQFHLQTADKYLWDESGKVPKKIQVSELWLGWAGRTVVTGRIFAPPPLGHSVQRLIKDKVNISPPWPETDDNPFDVLDFSPFDNLLRRFCETDRQHTWLRQHIAHTAKHPTELSSNAVVFADDGGTGKGLLFRTLRLLFGRLSVDIKDELTGKFNDRLAGRLIGLYDEPDYDRTENINIDKMTKRIIGNTTLTVEGKGLRPYTVENYLRLFVSMNLKYVGRISKHDRRWNYFTGGVAMSKEEGDAYADWLRAPSTPAALVQWCHAVDLQGFDPTHLGPVSTTRIKAIEYSQSIYEEFLAWEELLVKDVWSIAELTIMFGNFAPGHRKVNPISLGKNIASEEGASRVVKVDGKAVRLVALRSQSLWATREGVDWAKEARKGRA